MRSSATSPPSAEPRLSFGVIAHERKSFGPPSSCTTMAHFGRWKSRGWSMHLGPARRAYARYRCKQCSSQHRSEEHTSELQSLMRISYAVFCLKKKKPHQHYPTTDHFTAFD